MARGVRDRIVGVALTALHERPAHDWTVEELARGGGNIPVRSGRPLSSSSWEARRSSI